MPKRKEDKLLDKFVNTMMSKKYTILLATDQENAREAFIKEIEDDEPTSHMFDVLRSIFDDDYDMVDRLDKLEAELDSEDAYDTYIAEPSKVLLKSIAMTAAAKIRKSLSNITPIWKERFIRVEEFDIMLEVALSHGQTLH